MYRSHWQKWIAVLLVVLCVTTFFACSQVEHTLGLEITEDDGQAEELTPQEIDDLTTALHDVVMRVLPSGSSFSDQSVEEQLRSISQYLAQEVAQLTPTPREYAALTAVLKRYSTDEDFSAIALIETLYMDLVSALGTDKSATLVHRIVLKYCDYEAQLCLRRYEEYKYSFLLEDARLYRQKYQVLSTKLSPADLGAALNTFYMVGIVRSVAGQSKTGVFLTADEILTIVKAQNCTAVALDSEVWYELMTLVQPFVTHKYYGRIVDAIAANGDITLLVEGMNDLFALLRHVQTTLSAQDIQAIQRGEPLAAVLLSLLDDDQLRQIDAFLSQEWHYAKYDDLAQKQYGDDYRRFVQQTDTLTIDQLLEARRDATDATALLVGYLAGKSYALAWEVQS